LLVIFINAFLELSSTTGLAAPLSKPLFPIVFRVNAPDLGYPGYSTSELNRMADQSEAVWGANGQVPQSDDLAYLKSRHPGYTALVYLNGGHQGAWPETGPQLEDDRFDNIQVYRATKLTASINATANILSVESIAEIPVTGGAVDPRAATRSLDGRTGGDGGFISFIRVDNEIMRVTAKTTTPGPTLTVIRGTDGTLAGTHASGSTVLAPVYVTDYNPDGPLAVQDGTVRYSLNVGTVQLANLLADEFVADYMNSGWDGVWLDITAPSFYNMVDALDVTIDGETRFPFNTIAGADYTISTRAAHHDLKIGRIQAEIEASFGRLPVIYINNNADGKWFGDKGYGRRFAENNDAKIQPVDEVSLESPFVKPADPPVGYDDKGLAMWKKNVRTVADATNRGLAVCPWLKMVAESNYVPNDMGKPLGFGWASLLLSWGLHGNGSKVVLELWTASDSGGRWINLPNFMYYNMGEPLGSGPASDTALSALLVGDSTYRRDWTHGTVLMNPGDADDDSVDVSGYVNPDSCAPVHVSSLPAHSYKILMLPDACG